MFSIILEWFYDTFTEQHIIKKKPTFPEFIIIKPLL